MTAKRFTLIIDSEWWIVEDNSIKSNKYRNDLDGDDAYRGLKEGELTEKEVVDLLNELHEENKELKQELDNIYLLIGKGDWSGLANLLIDDEKCKTKLVKNIK